MTIFDLDNQGLIGLCVAAFRNVLRYHYDIKVLIEEKSYPRAIALAILGAEEWVKGIVFFAASDQIKGKRGERKDATLSFAAIV